MGNLWLYLKFNSLINYGLKVIFVGRFLQNLSSTYPGEEGLRVLADTLPKNRTVHVLRLECTY